MGELLGVSCGTTANIRVTGSRKAMRISSNCIFRSQYHCLLAATKPLVPVVLVSKRGLSRLILALVFVFVFSWAESEAGEAAEAVLQEYVLEVSEQQGNLSTADYERWADAFQRVIQSGEADDDSTMRMTEELGAIQRRLDRLDAALRTFRSLAAMAVSLKNVSYFETAVKNLGAVIHASAAGRPFDAKTLESVIQEISNLRKSFGDINPDATWELGIGILACIRDYPEAERKHLSPSALELLAESEPDIVNDDDDAVKAYWYSEALAADGKTKQSAEILRSIIGSNQDVMSPLWLSFKAISRTFKNIDERRIELAKTLKQHEESGREDEYELQFRHLLGLEYYRARQYGEAFDLFTSTIGKSGDRSLDAYNLFLAADCERARGNLDNAAVLYEQVVEEYGETGSAGLAASFLEDYTDMDVAGDQSNTDNSSSKAKSSSTTVLIIAANVIAVLFIILLIIYQKVRTR